MVQLEHLEYYEQYANQTHGFNSIMVQLERADRLKRRFCEDVSIP